MIITVLEVASYSQYYDTQSILQYNYHGIQYATCIMHESCRTEKTGGPLEAKWTICGNHTWSGGPVVVGDQLRHDSTLAGILNLSFVVNCSG